MSGNRKFLGVLIFAFVVATLGGILTFNFVMGRSQRATAAAPTVQIVVAAHDLEVGSVLREQDVQLASWPGAVPAGATGHQQDVVGRGVLMTMYAKEPVIDSRLAPKGAGGGLAVMIPKGMRALAIQVNEVVGVAGFVVPGMHVDVLISGAGPGGTGTLGMLSRTLLQNIEVLSAGQDFKKDAEGKPIPVQVVNVLVTPEQAEVLSLASNQTTIRLVLRNPLDREVSKTPGTALKYLFDGGVRARPVETPAGEVKQERAGVGPRIGPAVVTAQAAPPAKKEAPFTMEIISGATKTETKFDSKGEGK